MDFESMQALCGLSPVYSHALCRIADPRLRALAAVEMAYLHIPPGESERYVDAVLSTVLPEGCRELLDCVAGAVKAHNAKGGAAELKREDADNCLKLTVRVYRPTGEAPGSKAAEPAHSVPA